MSLKGFVASCSRGFLRLINLIIVLLAIPAIVLVFIIRPSPTATGWGLIGLAVVTLLSGLMGMVCIGQLACCGFHLFLVLISMVGLCATGIIAFVNSTKIYEGLSPTISADQGYLYVQILGILYIVLFCLQLLVLIMGWLISSCGFTDYNEDLEAQRTAKELARDHREAEERRSKIEATSAHRLALQMKEKYGVRSDYEVLKK